MAFGFIAVAVGQQDVIELKGQRPVFAQGLHIMAAAQDLERLQIQVQVQRISQYHGKGCVGAGILKADGIIQPAVL